MKISLKRDGSVSREEYNAIASAMSVLGNCIFPPTNGYVDSDGTDRVQIFMIPDLEDAIEALDTLASVFGFELREGRM